MALAIAVAVGTRIPPVSRVLAPVVGVGLALIYAVVLIVMRELRAADASWALGALRRKRPASEIV